MADVVETRTGNSFLRGARALARQGGLARTYLSALSGSAGRLIFSLGYFVALANSLSLADFGLFATASAAGIMLARLFALGFSSALYRTATVRPNLVGTVTGGFLMFALVSLPPIAIAAAVVYHLFFHDLVRPDLFAGIILAEVLLWRLFEVSVVVNNGLGLYARASVLTILGTAVRCFYALAFMVFATPTLEEWVLVYLSANGTAAILGFVFFYPKQRVRLAPALYWRRLPDAAYVACAEVLFYLQMEMDKLLVLSIGGANLAGLYAILMRLVDLTALPIRTFSMMLVQKMMRAPAFLASIRFRVAIEVGIFAVSTLAFCALATILAIWPDALGQHVAFSASLAGFALLVPAMRNLVEYHAELLFARGQTLIRVFNLALLTGVKAVLLVSVLTWADDEVQMTEALNGVFAALYLSSVLLTYSAMRANPKRV